METLAVGQFVYQISTIGFEAESTSLLSAWLLAGIGHTVAWLMMVREPRDAGTAISGWSDIARLIAAAAGAVFAIASIAWLSPLGATAALLTYAWVAATADRFDARPRLILHAVAMVAIAAVKWVIVDTLADRLAPGWSAMAHRPLLNPLMGAGMLISLSLVGIYWLRRDAWPRLLGGSGSAARQGALAAAAALIILVGMALSIEIDRVVERAIAAGAAIAMPPGQLKHLAWTMLWTTAALAYGAAAWVIEPDGDERAAELRRAAGWVLLMAMKFVIVDTLFYRVGNPPAGVTPLANLQVLAAMVVLGGLAGARALLVQSPMLSRLTAVAGILLVLWTGSLEIDRAFDGMAAQVALSIFWSLFAALCVGAGFRLRIAGLRYAGLGLFALTLLKVVVVDLRGVADGYRVLSFMGLGALLLGTSVLYGKLSPKLLEE